MAEDFDTAADTYRENQAMVMADQANINQLEALEGFKIVRAPFNGIVTARNTDLGDYVASGSGTQLFRTQQTSPLRVYVNVPQAFADLVKIGTEATRDLSKVTYQRYQDLFQRNVIAAQDFDIAADNYGQNQATVIADQANVNRLEALEAFKIVQAPFDGIVTARNTDIGAFIPLGSGTQLFRVARISPLRVYVDVPEHDFQ